jgi:hypothetical protein
MTESDKDNTTSAANVSPEWEMRLARQVRDLDREMLPTRNLWPGIERRIEAYPQPKKAESKTGWMQYGVAASVLMAFSALVLTVLDVPGTLPGSQVAAFDPKGTQTLDLLQVEYRKTRDPLVDRFTDTNRNLAPETLEELYRNIEIMAQARRDIEAQVRKDPTNPRLVELLMRVHEQELELLKQDFSQPSRSL